MKSLLKVSVTIALLALLAGPGGLARAQGAVIGEQSGKSAEQPQLNKQAMYRRALEEDKMRRERPQEAIRQVEAKPVLDAAGRHLVGMVGKRTLTKPQLDLRVNLIVQRLPPATEKNEEVDRRIGLEGRIVAEWERAAALAMLAEKQGFTATAQEVDQTIQDLSVKSSADPGQAVQQARMIGIPDTELRQEIADGIIVEKLIRKQVGLVRDVDLKEVFAKYPEAFLEPTRVKGWHLVAPLLNSPTADQLEELEKTMAKLGKRLSKCRDDEAYKALQQELDQVKGIMMTHLDDVASNEPMKKAVIKVLFELKPGKTSDVIASPPPPAKPTELHVVKVLERKEGHRGTFEEARPQVESLMAEKLKDLIYENMINDEQYSIRTDPAGLVEYREIGRIPAQSAVNAAAAPKPVATPRASLRTPFLPGRRVRTSAFGNDPPPVESVVGAPVDPVPPGLAATSPARNLDPRTGRPLLGGAAAAESGALPEVGNEAALADGTAEGLGIAPAAPADVAAEQAGTPLSPSLRRPSARRTRKPVRTQNFNVNPPSVEEALTRDAQSGGR